MTSFKKKFVSQDGKVFTVSEVCQTPAGLTVFYTNDKTQENYYGGNYPWVKK